MSLAVERGEVDGIESISLENAALRITVLPRLGGHVHELIDRAAGTDLLWHNERTPPRLVPYGAHFDDWWSGGWDEIFPSGDHGLLHGERLPYMGELWCVPWTAEVAVDGEKASVSMTGLGTIAPARFERTIWLSRDEPVVHVGYRIQSLDVRPLPFTWGIHPAFAVSTQHRIHHPGSLMLVGASSGPSMGTVGNSYRWPMLPDVDAPAGVRDMRCVRPREAGVFGGHWATDLPEGWLALTNTASRRGVALIFDRRMFPNAWLWQVYGGWRAHQHVALEPWTSHPQSVHEALDAGRARRLEPGATLETEVAVVLFDGTEPLTAVRTWTAG